MKKKSIYILMTLILFWGCIMNLPDDVPQASDVFHLTDRDGNPSTTFASGEDFYMYFNLVNTTQDSLDYSYTGFPVYFSIYKGTTRIVGSMDGLSFAQVLIETKLAPGDTLKGMWLAPTPPIQSTKIDLDPGQYRAVVTFPAIEALQTDTIPDINFTVLR